MCFFFFVWKILLPVLPRLGIRGSETAGVLAIDDIAMPGLPLHLARNADQLAEKAVVYTNGDTKVEKEIGVAIGGE